MEHHNMADKQCSNHLAEVCNSLDIQNFPRIFQWYVSINSCFENTCSVFAAMHCSGGKWAYLYRYNQKYSTCELKLSLNYKLFTTCFHEFQIPNPESRFFFWYVGPITCSWHQKTKPRIDQFTNLRCCIKAREPFKTPFWFWLFKKKNILSLAFSF